MIHLYVLSVNLFVLYIFVYFYQILDISLCILHIAFIYTIMYYIAIARNKKATTKQEGTDMTTYYIYNIYTDEYIGELKANSALDAE